MAPVEGYEIRADFGSCSDQGKRLPGLYRLVVEHEELTSF